MKTFIKDYQQIYDRAMLVIYEKMQTKRFRIPENINIYDTISKHPVDSIDCKGFKDSEDNIYSYQSIFQQQPWEFFEIVDLLNKNRLERYER